MKHRRLNPGRFALSGLAIATACLWGLNAQALGLGRLTVQSALGEPLRAEIDVSSLSADEAGTLKLRVASPDAYRAAGVDYNPVLPGTQVQLMRRPDGRAYLRVTSDRAVLEPFVDVILEMNWSSGRLVREYTLLLDPPSTPRNVAAAPAAAGVAPVISAAPAQPPAAAQTAAAPASPVMPRALPTEPRAGVKADAPTGATTPKSAAKSAGTAAPSAGAGADEYRVRPGDSLSRIAQNVQRPNVSLDQMLVALFRGNPDAFVGNNMNRLKSGELLTVPSAEAASQLGAPAAREVIRAQSADFAAYRQQLASGVTTTKTDEPARQAKGSVQASVQDSKQAAAPAPDKLTLSQGAVKASAPEAGLSKDAEKKDSATRVAELSRNVEELKRLQGETAATKASAPTGAVAPVGSSAASAPLVATLPAAAATVLPASAVAAVAAAPAAVVAAAPAMPALPAPKVAAPAAAEPGLLDSILDNPLLLPGAGVLVALIAGLGAYRLRGRMRKGDRETSVLESRLQPDSFFGASGGQRIDTHDAPSVAASSSSMSYSLSQLDAIGDVDPVAEADVYLAYGRDLQAEEILKEALRSQPQRMAVRTKLLEVYAKRRDTKGFELLAGQLFSLAGADSEDWHKAQEMGRQIDPENPLYAPGGQPDLIVREGGRLVEPLGATTMPQSVLPKAAKGPIAAVASLDLEPDLDVDLDLGAGGSNDTVAGMLEVTRPFTTGAAMSDDAPFAIDLPDTGASAKGVGDANVDTLGPLDFDLGELSLDDPGSSMAGVSARPPTLDLGDDFAASLPSFDLGDDDADPLSRKLELAEEFRQIGDMEGARDLLEEVVASADGALKTKAQGMLDHLS
ncbi:MAG: FimV/HubP family polar landmark protein [Rubrivivax sp.]